MLDIRNFLLAGKAIFTVVSRKSGARFTYKVKKYDKGDLWFVSVLTGPDNYSSYSYLGTIFPDKPMKVFRKSAKSRIGEDAQSHKAFKWLLNMVESGKSVEEYAEIHHEGRCGRCGRRLTVPESIESGFGPECIQHVMGG